MTPQEHLFMLTMYAKQNAKFNVLFEVLKTRGVVDADDLTAFLTHAEGTQESFEWTRKTWETYQSTAAILGVTTGLGNAPASQN